MGRWGFHLILGRSQALGRIQIYNVAGFRVLFYLCVRACVRVWVRAVVCLCLCVCVCVWEAIAEFWQVCLGRYSGFGNAAQVQHMLGDPIGVGVYTFGMGKKQRRQSKK